MSDRSSVIEKHGTGALDRNRSASTAMAVAARKLRFATSRRSTIYSGVGLRPRKIDRIFALAILAVFTFVLILPNVFAITYYGFLASDQFESETRFTVRSSAPMTQQDRLAQISGLPSAEIVQNSQIVTNFVTSRAMLTALKEDADFLAAYSDPRIDYIARLKSDATSEKQLEYWEDMVQTSIEARSGIITVDVRAFSAEQAHAIVKVLVAQSEQLINRLNDRIWADVTASARAQVDEASTKLNAARINLQDERNQTGMLSVEDSSSSLSTLLTTLLAERIDLQSRYDTHIGDVGKNAPQMKVMARQIQSKDQQIAEVKAQIASEGTQSGTLADASVRFSQLTFETSVAEEQLKSAIGALEQLQFSSQQQLMYLDPFLPPTMPEGAEFPRRFLWIGIVLVVSLLATMIGLSIVKTIRMRID